MKTPYLRVYKGEKKEVLADKKTWSRIKTENTDDVRTSVEIDGRGYPQVRWFYRGSKKPFKRMTLSRFALSESSHGVCVDHVDGNPFNNLRCNLRPATHLLNSMNKATSNKSGIKWVVEVPNGYKVQGWVNGEKFEFGTYPDKYTASLVAKEMQEKLHGPFARPTNPDSVKRLIEIENE